MMKKNRDDDDDEFFLYLLRIIIVVVMIPILLLIAMVAIVDSASRSSFLWQHYQHSASTRVSRLLIYPAHPPYPFAFVNPFW